ncbi:MAG TPA: double zinc ribbon domain-containing protein [Pyrinomonadaceae bacterium]|nr:double zinc ribbon domain-containing protein [Pyrinomonadaceae bacterium]
MRLTSRTVSIASSLYDAALALIYPQQCAVCGGSVDARANGVACALCWRKTRVFDGSETICWKCGAISNGIISEEKRTEVRCRRCEDESFAAARACGVYEGALRVSVLELKRSPDVSTRLALLLLETQKRAPLHNATLIVPVPLHAERLRERGFNQAAVLGASLARLSHLPFDQHSLVRRTHTERHRAGMDAQARRESVAGAFSVARPRLVANERILLIDDVLTTGATVSACAAALLSAGAQDVFVLTVARPV